MCVLHTHIPFVGQTYQDWWWSDNILFGRQVPMFQTNTIPSRWKQNIPLKCWYLCVKITWNYIIEDHNLNNYHHDSLRCHKQTHIELVTHCTYVVFGRYPVWIMAATLTSYSLIANDSLLGYEILWGYKLMQMFWRKWLGYVGRWQWLLPRISIEREEITDFVPSQ